MTHNAQAILDSLNSLPDRTACFLPSPALMRIDSSVCSPTLDACAHHELLSAPCLDISCHPDARSSRTPNILLFPSAQLQTLDRNCWRRQACCHQRFKASHLPKQDTGLPTWNGPSRPSPRGCLTVSISPRYTLYTNQLKNSHTLRPTRACSLRSLFNPTRASIIPPADSDLILELELDVV